MFFSKRFISGIYRTILKGKYNIYVIKLKTGIFSDDEYELTKTVDTMFLAWRLMIQRGHSNYLRNYDGIIKRLVFEHQKDTGFFSPVFYLFCIRKNNVLEISEEWKNKVQNEKLRVEVYIKWFSAWASALKLCTPVGVSFSLVELENLERVLGDFCSNEKYTLFPLVEEKKMELLKYASGNGRHKLVTYNGVFKDMNRQLSVER